MVRPPYLFTVDNRTVVFRKGMLYYIHYLTRAAPRATRKVYGAIFEKYEDGELYFQTPRGAMLKLEVEQLVNAL